MKKSSILSSVYSAQGVGRQIGKRSSRRSVAGRNCRGTLFAELAASLPIFIAMLTLGLDASLCVMAHCILDETCVDAARAASMAPDIETASARAAAVARIHQRSDIVPTVRMVKFDTKDGKYLDGPYLVLETTVNYKLPFPIIVFSQTITPGSMELKRLYSYPILPVAQTPPASP